MQGIDFIKNVSIIGGVVGLDFLGRWDRATKQCWIEGLPFAYDFYRKSAYFTDAGKAMLGFAKGGALIGSLAGLGFSMYENYFAVRYGDRKIEAALQDMVLDTVSSAISGAGSTVAMMGVYALLCITPLGMAAVVPSIGISFMAGYFIDNKCNDLRTWLRVPNEKSITRLFDSFHSLTLSNFLCYRK